MELTTLKAHAYIHHLVIESPTPDGLAAWYADVLDMTVSPVGNSWLLLGPGRRIVIAHGAARRLRHVGLAVRDAAGLAEIRERAQRENLDPEDCASGCFDAGAFCLHDPDGNAVVFGLAPQDPPRSGLRGPLQHVTFATRDIDRFVAFYSGKLGLAISDRVVRGQETTTVFLRSNHEHHTIGVFQQDRTGVDHVSFEAGEWDVLKDWCDRFADRRIRLDWGPGRHGPGNNLFAFITDPDGNWIEISAELEVVQDRPEKVWPHEERTLNLWGPGRLRV